MWKSWQVNPNMETRQQYQDGNADSMPVNYDPVKELQTKKIY